ncbi:MAG: zf-HC2 domain-containing protein [Candidatus Atribacteria bacterium]|nr:zf-HC2 domain-containing protein [Candidatus Atribacteria bacterium]
MDCKEAVAQLYLYLDGEVLTSEERKEIEEHLRLCRKCCQKFEFERNLMNLVKAKCLDIPVPQTFIHKIESVIASF